MSEITEVLCVATTDEVCDRARGVIEKHHYEVKARIFNYMANRYGVLLLDSEIEEMIKN
jgi:hypothetical protein